MYCQTQKQCQVIIWTNVGMLLIGNLATSFSETLIGIQAFSFKKMQLQTESAKSSGFCLGLNVLIDPLGHSDAICGNELCRHWLR